MKRIRGAFQTRGHEELALSLPGVADRSQLLSEQVDLGARITVVANLIRYEELPDRLLCGHSCGGCEVQTLPL